MTKNPMPEMQATPPWPAVDSIPASTPLDWSVSDSVYTSIKPAIDMLVSVVLLPFVLPFIGLGWLLIKLTSPGRGFYVQTRSGHQNKPYKIIKIRSMHDTKAVALNTNWATSNDTRITPIGKLLRALHLDELPQIFNVLRGEMSLVGPRPERPEVINQKGLGRLVPGYELRTQARPGVTGFAQVQLPADSDVTSVRHKIYYDLYYLANQSLWFDLRICAATVLKAFLSPTTLQKVLFLPSPAAVQEFFIQITQASECAASETSNTTVIVPVIS